MLRDHIKQLVELELKALKFPDPGIEINYPSHPQFGDYSTNVALKLAKQTKQNPLELAKQISTHMATVELFSKVEVAPPGFINFSISRDTLFNYLNEKKYQQKQLSDLMKGQNVIIEYTDPNPFKEFHIGHLYSNIVGESLSRLYEAVGANVARACYQGDVGLHVAKALWGIQHLMNQENLQLKSLQTMPLEDRVSFMGRAYAYGAQMYEDSEESRSEIHILNKKVYEKDPSIYELYTEGRQWSLDYFETIYKELGTKFTYNFFESQVGKLGLNVVKDNLKTGIFKESNGAVVFEGEQYGLHTRVFINSLGLPTYEAKDLGLAPTKYQKFAYDVSIIVTGNEINEYFKVVLKALELIRPDLREKTKHISHGMVRLPEGKMSSRTGNIITGKWLINEASRKSFDIIQQTTQAHVDGTKARLTPGNQLGTAEKVGLGAIKYALLKNTIGKNVEFDFDESISFEGNSGPYLQYTYVRCLSVLNKASMNSTIEPLQDLHEEESNLLRILPKFEELVVTAAINNSPNLIATYLYELAAAFNLFYQKHTILKADDRTKEFRLALTSAVAQILKNGLYLLGIETVEKM